MSETSASSSDASPLVLPTTDNHTLTFTLSTFPTRLPAADWFSIWASPAPALVNVTFAKPGQNLSDVSDFDRVKCVHVVEDPSTTGSVSTDAGLRSDCFHFQMMCSTSIFAMCAVSVVLCCVQPFQRLTCFLPPWYNVANRLFVSRDDTGAGIAMSNHTVRSPPPPRNSPQPKTLLTLADCVLRGCMRHGSLQFDYTAPRLTKQTLHIYNQPITSAPILKLPDGNKPNLIAVQGINFGPPGNRRSTQITYAGTKGPFVCDFDEVRRSLPPPLCSLLLGVCDVNGGLHECERQKLSTTTQVVCRTAVPSDGLKFKLTITVGVFSVTTDDLFSIPQGTPFPSFLKSL